MKKTVTATEAVPSQPATRRPRRSNSSRSDKTATPNSQPATTTTPESVAETAAVAQAADPAVATDKKKKKDKVVRDSFTMPKSDYDKIAELKKKTLEAGVSIKKSELLRAGLLALDAMPITKLKAMLAQVESVKTGRPSSKQR